MRIKSGSQMLLGYYTVSMSKISDTTYSIDRVYVYPSHRKQGVFSTIINTLVNEADKEDISLYMNIYPDGYAQGTADDIADGMRCVAERNGFTPLELDGEVYRNDVTYKPRGDKQCLKLQSVDP